MESGGDKYWQVVVPAMPGKEARKAFGIWLAEVKGTEREPKPENLELMFVRMANGKSGMMVSVWTGPPRVSFHSRAGPEKAITVVSPMRAREAKLAFDTWYMTMKGTPREPRPEEVQIRFHRKAGGTLVSYDVRAARLRS